jgi:hypothetical protein
VCGGGGGVAPKGRFTYAAERAATYVQATFRAAAQSSASDEAVVCAAAAAATYATISADADQSAEKMLARAISDTLSAAAARWAGDRDDLLRAGGPWTFWDGWYARSMAGDPLPWDLQERIALIPNEIWEAGPEAVAEEIARIEAEFELRHRIADFETDQAPLEKKRFGIGGNNPPVEIDDPETGAQVVVIWESIAGLKEEVNAEKPDAKRVATLIERLSAALRLVVTWCGRKADLAVDTTIKWGIPAAAGGYFYLNPAKAEAVLKAAQDWLPFLGP